MFMIWMALSAGAAMRSGKATAEWISASTICAPGEALQTAFRLTLDDGWHTYWLNPGAAGMKTRVEWELPAGWSVTGPAYPVPERFMTGGLPGFGYSGTVIFPVTVTPPADYEGGAELKARISWLACNDGGCVPGDVELSLDLKSGLPAATPEAEIIRDALRKIPRERQGQVLLEVQEKPTTLVLSIMEKGKQALDLTRCEVFPATLNVMDPAAGIHFIRSAEQWVAEVPKSGYAEIPVKLLTLVVAGEGAEAPIELTWKSP